MREPRHRVVEHRPAPVDGGLRATPQDRRARRPQAGGARAPARASEAQVAQAAQGAIEQRPRVLLILGVGRTPFAFLPNSWGGDVVTQAGGRLLTGGRRVELGGFARISDESRGRAKTPT